MIIPIYNIIRSNVPEPALAEREILQQVKLCKHTPIRITFFTDIACNEGYIEQRERIEACCKELFGNKRPVVALVVQPPLECKLLAEVTYIDAACEVEYHDDYILLDGCQLYTAAIYSSLDKCIEEQSDDIFEHLNRILALQGFAINDIVRQWNYIEHITHISAQGQNYQQFNDSRSRFYNRTTWQNGYPAATGIGTGGGGVVVMVDAIKVVAIKVLPSAAAAKGDRECISIALLTISVASITVTEIFPLNATPLYKTSIIILPPLNLIVHWFC